jgi:hypothetical protein
MKHGRMSLQFAEGFDTSVAWTRLGIGITPGGGIVRIPPRGPVLHPFTRQALTGLVVREIASMIDDAIIRRTVDQAGAGLVKKALEQFPCEG